MINVVCVKWGDKYSSKDVNTLYRAMDENLRWAGNGSITFGQSFNFYCYTDDPTGLTDPVKIIPIESGLTGVWPKLDILNIFDKGETIYLDLDVIIMNPLTRLVSTNTRTLTVLYSQWKEGFLQPRAREKFPTLYNSSIMKWKDDQGKKIYDHFIKHKSEVLLKYKGIDRFLFNEPVEVDLFQTGIAYSYWKGVRYLKDTTPEKERTDFEVCILNEGPKEGLAKWTTKYL